MRRFAKGMMFGSIVGSALGMMVLSSRRNGMSRRTRKIIGRTGKFLNNMF